MAKTQEDIDEQPQDPDLLAAVVLHVLVTEGAEGASLEQVARICERDPDDEAEREEVRIALEILVRDDLAVREGEGHGGGLPAFGDADGSTDVGLRFRPTRAAVRAAELSF